MKRKLLALVLIGTLLLLCLGACSGSSSKDTDAITKIKDRGVLKVGCKVDVPKFGYENSSTGKKEGLEIDLAKRIAKELLGDETKVEFTGVTAKTRGPLLENGEIDLVIATFTITDERKETYNFSTPYFTDAVGLLVKKDAGITSFQSLDDKSIGVAQGATSKDAIQKKADADGMTITFAEYASYPEIKAALDSGRVDCFSVDGSILAGYVDDTTMILDEYFSPQEYGVASKKSNTELANKVDEIIKSLLSSGEMDQLIATWDIKKPTNILQ